MIQLSPQKYVFEFPLLFVLPLAVTFYKWNIAFITDYSVNDCFFHILIIIIMIIFIKGIKLSIIE